MSQFDKSNRSRVRRIPARGQYDEATVHAILDAAPICHVGFEVDGQPYVIPTLLGREGNSLYLHGAKASRLLKHVAAGRPVCITATLVDGLVLARSLFHHSMNYRSAVVFGRGEAVEGDDEKTRALQVISEALVPGRWADARGPNAKELAATAVVRVAIEDASAKIRTGPPVDDEEDYALPIWAGVVPLHVAAGTPEPDARLDASTPMPDVVRTWFPAPGAGDPA